MKIYCPGCGRPVGAGQVDLEGGSANCGGCGREFNIADASPEAASTSKTPWPFDARTIVQSSPDELAIRVPPKRFSLELVSMAVLGIAFIWFAYRWASGMARNPMNPWEWNATVVGVGIAMSICGLGPLAKSYWILTGEHQIRVDPQQIVLNSTCPGFRFNWQSPIENLIELRHSDSPVPVRLRPRDRSPKSMARRYLELIFSHGSFAIPVNSLAEAQELKRMIVEFMPERQREGMNLSSDLDSPDLDPSE